MGASGCIPERIGDVPHAAHSIDQPSVETQAVWSPFRMLALQNGAGQKQPLLLPQRQGIGSGRQIRAGFDFDQRQNAVAFGDDIDLAGGRANAPAMNDPATLPQSLKNALFAIKALALRPGALGLAPAGICFAERLKILNRHGIVSDTRRSCIA